MPINTKFTITQPYPGVFHAQFADKYVLSATMMRVEEYYESPSYEIRKNFFTIEQLMDHYVDLHGGFTYFDDWGGFNIPGSYVRDFIHEFKHDLMDKEDRFFYELTQVTQSYPAYYLIATHESGWKQYYKHELAHAFYYLDDEYFDTMTLLNEKCTHSKSMCRRLIKDGYGDHVLHDELQAYLATSSNKFIADEFGIKQSKAKELSAPYKKYFKQYLKSKDKV